MSLINDALKRARREAAEREAERKGFHLPSTPSHVPFTRGSDWPRAIVLIALGAAVATAIVLTVAWMGPARVTPANVASAEPGPPPSAEVDTKPTAGVEATSPAAASTEPLVAEPAATSTPRRSASPPAAEADRGEAVTAERPIPKPATRRETRPPTRSDEPATDTASDLPTGGLTPPAISSQRAGGEPQGEAAGRAATSAPPEQDYLREARLADGIVLSLGGIAWSETGSFALINGEVVGRGERVESATVVEIRPGEVLLRDAEGRALRLRLR